MQPTPQSTPGRHRLPSGTALLPAPQGNPKSDTQHTYPSQAMARSTPTPTPATKDGPGLLSKRGPRHDNDFSDISEIRIMPTVAEILSLRDEYLPTSDASKFHLPGLQGYLDRHFRLIREEEVRGLRDAMRTHLGISNHDEFPDRDRQLHTNLYQVQAFELTSFWKDGLEIRLEVQQPMPPSWSNSAANRERWWMQNKALDWDALVCLVGKGLNVEHSFAIFCTVSRSTVRNVEMMKGAKPQAKLEKTLFGKPATAHLVLNLVDALKSDIDTILRISRGNMNKLKLVSSLLMRYTPQDIHSPVVVPSLIF
jgi:hypothetical protein